MWSQSVGVTEHIEKIIPKLLKVEGRSPQNGDPGLEKIPPRHHFQKTSNLTSFRGGVRVVKFAILGQLGSKLEAQDPPKSRPKPEKIDVEKRHIFDIDF